MIGYSYFGLLDDVVERYPFPFKMDATRLKFELSTQLIDGKPLYLNDGYLVLHPVCRKSIQDMDGLIWHLITRGFITVLHRGGENYRLDEMPQVMADKNIESYQKLINNEIPGVMKWEEYKKILSHIHDILEGTRSYQQWPPYKTESGFVVLSKKLLENDLSLSKTNMRGMCWSKSIITDFLQEFVYTFDPAASGPRNYWEHLADKYSHKLSVTFRPKAFKNGMMCLANELYHYNFGVMLSAQGNVPISVETKNSSCFDFLFSDKEYLAEEVVKIPKLNVPQSILTAPDSDISKIFDSHRDVGKSRLNWLNIKSEFGINDDWDEVVKAATDYSREISSLLGSKVNLGFKEDLFGYVLGKLTGEVRGETAATLGASAGGALGGPAGAAVGAISGYGLAKAHKHYAGKITDKYKIYIMNKRLVNKIKNVDYISNNSHIPSSYTLSRDTVQALIKDYEKV